MALNMLSSLKAHPLTTTIPEVNTTPTLSASKSASPINRMLWSILTTNATFKPLTNTTVANEDNSTKATSMRMVLPTFCRVYKPNEMTAKFFDVFPEGRYRQTFHKEKGNFCSVYPRIDNACQPYYCLDYVQVS